MEINQDHQASPYLDEQGHHFPGGLEIPYAHKVNMVWYVYIWKTLYINRFTNWRGKKSSVDQ